MSFILKALKKVEQEKAARGSGPVDVHSALLHGGDTAALTTTRLARWGVSALVFIAGSGLTYFLMNRSSEPPRRAQGRSVDSAQGSALPAPVLATPPLPGDASSSQAAPTTPDNPASRPTVTTASLPEPAAVSTSPRRPAAVPDRPAAGPTPPQDAAGSPPPGLKVNGIALQDDPAESVAVVNGALLKRGMTVEGMRVEEILQDRVRFSGNGGIFEVHLSR